MCLGLIEYVLISIKINAIGWYMSNYDRPRDSVHLAMSLAFSLSLAYGIQIDFWFFSPEPQRDKVSKPNNAWLFVLLYSTIVWCMPNLGYTTRKTFLFPHRKTHECISNIVGLLVYKVFLFVQWRMSNAYLEIDWRIKKQHHNYTTHYFLIQFYSIMTATTLTTSLL